MLNQIKWSKGLHNNEISGRRNWKGKMKNEILFWKNSIEKERLGALAVFIAIGALGSIVYTLINLIY